MVSDAGKREGIVGNLYITTMRTKWSRHKRDTTKERNARWPREERHRDTQGDNVLRDMVSYSLVVYRRHSHERPQVSRASAFVLFFLFLISFFVCSLGFPW